MTMPNRFNRHLILAALLLGCQFALADDFQDASTLFKQGQQAKAMEKINAILSAKPKDAQARFLKGLILTDQGKTNEAISTFTSLTNDYPELPEPYNNLAVLYAGQGQYEKAKVALEVAIRTHPSYATAHENLGDIYAKMASQAYDRALQLDKSNPAAQTKLELIRELFTSGRPNKGGKPVAAAVAPVASAAVGKPAAAPASKANESDAVLKAVNAWAAAWSEQSPKKYLAAYAKDFKTPNGESRSEWEDARASRLTKPKFIHVALSDTQVSLQDDSHATVTFRQAYRASHLTTSGSKTLLMVKSGGVWLIQEERAE